MFEKYDTDGSGSIDPEEFRELALKMSGEPWNDEELAKAIREIDKGTSCCVCSLFSLSICLFCLYST